MQVQSGAAWVGWGFVSARGAPQVAASLGRGTAYNVVTQALAARQASAPTSGHPLRGPTNIRRRLALPSRP